MHLIHFAFRLRTATRETRDIWQDRSTRKNLSIKLNVNEVRRFYSVGTTDNHSRRGHCALHSGVRKSKVFADPASPFLILSRSQAVGSGVFLADSPRHSSISFHRSIQVSLALRYSRRKSNTSSF